MDIQRQGSKRYADHSAVHNIILRLLETLSPVDMLWLSPSSLPSCPGGSCGESSILSSLSMGDFLGTTMEARFLDAEAFEAFSGLPPGTDVGALRDVLAGRPEGLDSASPCGLFDSVDGDVVMKS